MCVYMPLRTCEDEGKTIKKIISSDNLTYIVVLIRA